MKLLLAIFLLAMNYGCATMLLLEPDVTPDRYYDNAINSEKVLSFHADLKDANSTVAFVGEHNTYFVRTGNRRIVYILNSHALQEIDRNRVIFTNKLIKEERKFKGTILIELKCPDDNSPISNDSIEKIGFIEYDPFSKKDDVCYKATIYVDGDISPSQTSIDPSSTHWADFKELKFYREKGTGSPYNFLKVIFLPVTLAIDIITLPFQIYAIHNMKIGW
jgi:hypothetical protein